MQELAVDLRAEIYGSIMLSGGSTLFPGFPTRLKSDLYGYLKEEVDAGRRANNAIKIRINV
jgi:actin-related protein 2